MNRHTMYICIKRTHIHTVPIRMKCVIAQEKEQKQIYHRMHTFIYVNV